MSDEHANGRPNESAEDALQPGEALQKKLDHLPPDPGVYKHLDDEGRVLYVGKAKNLRSRVRSYFHQSRPRDGRIRAMLKKVADLDVIVTDTEAEALILENNLIKEHQPRYNVNLKDDKTYPYICVKNERFPSDYFGPYTDSSNMKEVLGVVRSAFKLRTCKLDLEQEKIDAGKYDVCLEYHIENCKGPCEGYQSEADYNETIEQVKQLLRGHVDALTDRLEEEMERAAEGKDYEKAARRRDQIEALRKHAEKQKIVAEDRADRDVFAVHTDREEGLGVGVVFKVREGKVIGRQERRFERVEGRPDEELLLAFLENYYADAAFVPGEVLCSHDPDAAPADDAAALRALLREKNGRKVPIRVPQRGDKASLVRMTKSNAKLLAGEWKLQKLKRGEKRVPHSVKALQESLRLDDLPRRIEAFDISHLGGSETVASLVVFKDGKPRKSDYRTFKIRGAEGTSDDYAAMREVVRRRYRRVKSEDGPWPDLVVIDGGKGQLSSAVESLREKGVYGRFPVIGLAKRLEEVFVPGDSDPKLIAKDSTALQLLQQVRDEAHRFAVTYQRKRRENKTLRSELLDIKGIGPRRRARWRAILPKVGPRRQRKKRRREQRTDANQFVNGSSFVNPSVLPRSSALRAKIGGQRGAVSGPPCEAEKWTAEG
ncbi:MAG: excinuclease ABC subunit C [Bacteroidetes bacterium QH_8_67_23]|nr:MAG: excinuclease ABC subunit C [Bacteroidetes bacterium QH_8_67_23]